jgi:hypothetical protein
VAIGLYVKLLYNGLLGDRNDKASVQRFWCKSNVGVVMDSLDCPYFKVAWSVVLNSVSQFNEV